MRCADIFVRVYTCKKVHYDVIICCNMQNCGFMLFLPLFCLYGYIVKIIIIK